MEIIVVIENGEFYGENKITADSPISFSEVMKRLQITFYKPCGGAGRCYRCGIRFAYGAPDITELDERAFSAEQLRSGMRLGCNCTIDRDCRIVVPDFLVSPIVTNTQVDETSGSGASEADSIAVDIGTTTVVVAAVNRKSGAIVDRKTFVNPQLEYGADVMTRIKAAMNGDENRLSTLIKKQLKETVGELTGRDCTHFSMIISANTTMMHLYMNYPVDGLANYPFEPYSLSASDGDDCSFIPSISAFVGGDIVSGLYYLGDRFTQGVSLFIDFGTNAEIVLYDGVRYFVTSTSCGPALEGGNISCGVAAVMGAISHVRIINGMCITETIGGGKPIGICGSGVVDLVCEMKKAGIIDSFGLLQKRYLHAGYEVAPGIFFTNEDIEQVLLAKSAIYSGIMALLARAGIDISQVDRLYASGGFGAGILPESAAYLGMIPVELQSKYESVGNTSLAGAVKSLGDKYGLDTMSEIVEKSTQHELANDEYFQKLFLENLSI